MLSLFFLSLLLLLFANHGKSVNRRNLFTKGKTLRTEPKEHQQNRTDAPAKTTTAATTSSSKSNELNLFYQNEEEEFLLFFFFIFNAIYLCLSVCLSIFALSVCPTVSLGAHSLTAISVGILLSVCLSLWPIRLIPYNWQITYLNAAHLGI